MLLVVAIATILLLSGCVGLAHSQHKYSQSGLVDKRRTRPIVVTFTPSQRGRTFALGAVGLSIEALELATRDLSASHGSLVALMRQLGSGVLRLGGSSLDSSWWTSDNERRPSWATSVVTPADLTTLRRLLDVTDWKAVLGIDFGHYDPTRAANEAGLAARSLGPRLLGFEIGNEPNVYGIRRVHLRPASYNLGSYLNELDTYAAAIHNVVPGARLYGPDVSSLTWLQAIASNQSTSLAATTLHSYPTSYSVSNSVCKGTPVPTALDLLSPLVREEEDATLRAFVRTGGIAHRETRISETNSTGSCDADGGPATSPVFASALWSLDWALRAAHAGVAGLNFHGYFGRCGPNTVSPICAPTDTAEVHGQVIARPEYYGLLAARQLEGGNFIPVRLAAHDAGGQLAAYATSDHRGGITLAIDDFLPGESASLLLKAPGYKTATSELLMAPSLSATSRVTFGHASPNASGILRPKETPVPKVGGAFRLNLRAASAVVVRLRR